MIYLDNCATTQPDPSVVRSFEQVSHQYFANASSLHQLGGEAERLYVQARKQAATLLGIQENEVVFTSGGTEGNNLAIQGIARQYKNRGTHMITTEIEHPSVFETFKSLEDEGFQVTYLPVNQEGVISLEQLKGEIREDTILISIMHVNNEIGSVQPIQEIGEIAKKHPKLFLHVDAVQSLGKFDIDLTNSGIDLCTYSGHKIHGLKGTGMIFIREGTSLSPLFYGGGQEFSFRSGTENIAGHVSFVRALRLIGERDKKDHDHLKEIKSRLEKYFITHAFCEINSPQHSAPHIMNVSVPGLKPETIINKLGEHNIYISTQSACSSKKMDESRVLLACGYSTERAISGLRISTTFSTTEADIEVFLKTFDSIINQLKDVME